MHADTTLGSEEDAPFSQVDVSAARRALGPYLVGSRKSHGRAMEVGGRR